MLFTPTRAYKSILNVTPEILSEMGVRALILDIDNTMTTHDNPVPVEGLFEWLDNTAQPRNKDDDSFKQSPAESYPLCKAAGA